MRTGAATAQNTAPNARPRRDHAGGPDAAVAIHGGTRAGEDVTHRARLDALMTRAEAAARDSTPLFRLHDTDDAATRQDRRARAHIRSRIFPCSDRWRHLARPGPGGWDRIEAAS